MTAAVVVPTYERPDRLASTVETVCNQTTDNYEVLVVDDGSASDAQESALERIETFDRVRVLRQENAGPAAARNRGWRATSGDPVLFTDDDCLVPRNWVERLVAGFDDDPDVGAVGGPLLPTAAATERSVFARLHRYRNEVVYDQPTAPTTGGADLPMGGTANIAYRRAALEAVDGFDETFPTAAGEDADLQKRVADAGWLMKFVPVVVEHNDDYDWGSFSSRAVRHGQGTYYYARRHGSPRPAWRVVLGLVAAPLSAPRAITEAGSVRIGVLSAVERALSRWGELRALSTNR